MKYELQKFGPIEDTKISEKDEKDDKENIKVLVKYHNLASAFACYNLLSKKPYMGKPVEILFVSSFWENNSIAIYMYF